MNEYNKTESDSQIQTTKERFTSGERGGGEGQEKGRGLEGTHYHVVK